MDKNLVRATALATKSVIKDMIGWDLRVDGITTKKSPANQQIEMNVIITFNGQMSGAFILHCVEPVSAVIVSEMMGSPYEAGSADVKDAMGELLNMISGAVKNHYQSESDPFKISVPTVVVGTDFAVHVKVKHEDEIISLAFQHDGGGEIIGLKLILVSE